MESGPKVLPTLEQNMKLFLATLGESIPPWVFDGLCNAYAVMIFRASISNEQNRYLIRLQTFESLPESKVDEIGKIYQNYLSQLKDAIKRELPKLKKLLDPLEKDLNLIEAKMTSLSTEKEKNREQLDALELQKKSIQAQIDEKRAIHFDQIEKSIKERFTKEKIKSIEYAHDIYFFIHTFLGIYFPGKFFKLKFEDDKRYVKQSDVLKLIVKFLPTDALIKQLPHLQKDSKDDFPIKHVISLQFNLSKKELITQLEENIKEGDLIYVNGVDHAIFMTKTSQGYQITRFPSRLQEAKTANQAADLLLNCFELDPMLDQNPLGFEIFEKVNPGSDKTKKVERPSGATIAEEILRKRGNKPDIDAESQHGTTSLWLAATSGNTELVRLLLSMRANPNIAHRERGITPAYQAACHDNCEVLQLLGEYKADLNQGTSKSGDTPAIIAAVNNNLLALKTLQLLKVDFNKENKTGITPACAAASHGHIDVLKYFAELKVDLNKGDNNGVTPFFKTILTNKLDAMKFLISQKIKTHTRAALSSEIFLNKADSLGRLKEMKELIEKSNNGNVPKFLNECSPLHAAVYAGNVDIVEQLLHLGFDPLDKLCGFSPLEFAHALGLGKVIAVLQKKEDLVLRGNPSTLFQSESGEASETRTASTRVASTAPDFKTTVHKDS